jgi:formylglycine-generating enzyme required for sulfatase activity
MANQYGLHDTAGNVFEWVADCYHDSFASAPTDGSPLDKPVCGKRVIRGGAWSFPPKEIRSANRWRDFPSRHSDDTGFRVVREMRDSSH